MHCTARKIKKFITNVAVKILSICTLCSIFACNNLPNIPGTEILIMDNRRIEHLVRQDKQASYTLVFESGARNCIQRWATLLQLLPSNLNYYVYNRPGYCASSGAVTARTSENIVKELRQSLAHQGLRPPYILIGHSLGGLYMQHFARQHPEEVQGLILIDALYPGVLKKPEEFPWYTKIGMVILLTKDMRAEINRAHASGLSIETLPTIDKIPTVRMFNHPQSKIDAGSAREIDLGMLNRDQVLITKVNNMYPHAKVVVADSSHQMQETSAELVIQALDYIMQATPGNLIKN